MTKCLPSTPVTADASVSDSVCRLCRLFLACLMVAFMAGCAAQTGDGGAGSGFFGQPQQRSLTDYERNLVEQNKGEIALSVPASAKPLVEKKVAYYLGPGRKTIEKHSKQAEKYLGYAKEVFRSRNMPEDLAYLAIVESGYNVKACSQSGAKGAWQFMAPTGEQYGLEHDNWGDERMSVYAATIAAADYLEKLYAQFGDWPTAIAAYNAGERKVSNACKAAHERTFFGVVPKNDRLNEKVRLKKETIDYVPKFLAVTSIMKNLSAFGFDTIHPEAMPKVSEVALAPGTDLKAMAGVCHLSWAEFKDYNPHFFKDVSHKNRSTVAYVPEKARPFACQFAHHPVLADSAKLASAEKQPLPLSAVEGKVSGAGKKYTIRRGDTLYSVAQLNKTTVPHLLAANNLSSAKAVYVGQTIVIPNTKTGYRTASKTKNGTTTAYCVQPRDNLYQISRRLNVSVDDLKRWNGLSSENLRVGQRLVVR